MFTVTTLMWWQHVRNPIALNFINPRTKNTSKCNVRWDVQRWHRVGEWCGHAGEEAALGETVDKAALFPTQPRGSHFRHQSLQHTSPGVCSPQFASETACGWDQDFSCKSHVHGWGSCNPPSPSGPRALMRYSHLLVLNLTTLHARVCSWASLTRCLSSVNRCKYLFIPAEAVHHSL